MKRIEIVLDIIEKEINDGIEFSCEIFNQDPPSTYKDFIELVYDGQSKLFKDDLYFEFVNNRQFDFVTDDVEIIEEDGNIVSYRKLVNEIKRKFFSNDLTP